MTAKVLSTTCLSDRGPAVALRATRLAFGVAGRPAKRPERGDVAFFHRIVEVAGAGTRFGGRFIGLGRLSGESADWDGWDNSAQAGGTDRGP